MPTSSDTADNEGMLRRSKEFRAGAWSRQHALLPTPYELTTAQTLVSPPRWGSSQRSRCH